MGVLRFSAFGDVILLSPALDALRTAWPDTQLVVATARHLAPLLRGLDVEVLPLEPGESVTAYAARLRVALGEDAALLDLHGKVRSLALRVLIPWRWPRVVWQKRSLADTLAVRLRLRPWRADRLQADRYHLAVEALVGRPLPRGRLRVVPDRADVERARALLPSGRILGLSPGAAWATKRWSAARFAEVARRALADGWSVVVQGSPAEAALCEEVAAAAPGAVVVLPDIPTLIGLVSLCEAFVANDSGPMHLARALRVPTVAVFGSTDPGMFAWEGHAALRCDLPCSPCSFHGRASCPLGHMHCLEVPAAEVWERLLALERPPTLGG